MDRSLRTLEQQLRAAPGDPAARLRLRAALCRVANLEDREAWAAADEGAQDLVLDLVARLLEPAYEALEPARFAAGGAAHRVGRFRHRRTGVVLHLLPGGEFRMGSPGAPDELPERTVRVPPFLIGRYPLLQREWDRLGGPDHRSWPREDRPMNGVSWHESRDWAARAGGELRLPSEAEWEYACRAGTRSAYFWGEEVDEDWCWFGQGDAWCAHPPHEHDQRANAFGLVDMAGNVFEWCEDAYGRYWQAPADGQPLLEARTRQRVLRGGDSFNGPDYCRSARRHSSFATDRGGGIGLRVARSCPC